MVMHYILPTQERSIEDEILEQIEIQEFEEQYEEQLVNEFLDTFLFYSHGEDRGKYHQH